MVDEGAYGTFFVTGDLADTKRFFEGRGRSLQMKNKTCPGMSWVGVPIILAVNNYHHYLEREPYTNEFIANKKERRLWKDEEEHRLAFMHRVEAVELQEKFNGKT